MSHEYHNNFFYKSFFEQLFKLIYVSFQTPTLGPPFDKSHVIKLFFATYHLYFSLTQDHLQHRNPLDQHRQKY